MGYRILMEKWCNDEGKKVMQKGNETKTDVMVSANGLNDFSRDFLFSQPCSLSFPTTFAFKSYLLPTLSFYSLFLYFLLL